MPPAVPTRAHSKIEAGLRVLAGIAIALLLGHLAILLWARHEFTQVESVVALHSNMLADTGRLYYDLGSYPFTVSPYGPIFYWAVATLHGSGVPLFQAGRCISFAATLLLLWLAWRLLQMLVVDRFARVLGLLLAAVTANLLHWGTTGQVDLLALTFSFAAFVQFIAWRQDRAVWRLVAAGVLVVLAVFTKQTAIAAGAAVAIALLIEDRKCGLIWVASMAAVGLTAVATVNHVTEGRYLANAVHANLNPFALEKLQAQTTYILLTAGGLLLLAVLGLRRWHPLYLYTLLAGAVFLATAAKVGSDLNYQVEFTLLLAVCAACTLDRLHFFEKLVARDRSWVTLLPIPILLHIVLNTVLTGRVLLERVLYEKLQREETAALQPYLDGRQRVLSTQLNTLVHTHGRMEVEPLIYTLLVGAGLSDAEPVRRDLAAQRFDTVILYEDVFTRQADWKNSEVPSLPDVQLAEIRKHYRLARHIPGRYLQGDYVYEPIRD